MSARSIACSVSSVPRTTESTASTPTSSKSLRFISCLGSTPTPHTPRRDDGEDPKETGQAREEDHVQTHRVGRVCKAATVVGLQVSWAKSKYREKLRCKTLG